MNANSAGYTGLALLLLTFFCSPPSSAGTAQDDLHDLIREADRLFNRNDYPEALVRYRKVHERLKDRRPHPVLYAEVINDMAAVHLAEGRFSEFQADFQRSKALKQKSRNTSVRAGEDSNLLVNGGFEDGLVFPWGTGHYERTDGRFKFGIWWNSKNAKAFMKIDSDQRYSGRRSLRMTNYSATEPHVFSTLSQRISGLKPNSVYRISYYAKALDLSPGAVGFAVDAAWTKQLPRPPRGSYGWRRFDARINIGHNDYIDFRIIHQNTGTLWLDDIVVEPAEDEDKSSLQQAESLFDAGEYARALETYRRQEAEAGDNPRRLAHIRWRAGRVHAALGEYPRALEGFQLALTHGLRHAHIDMADLQVHLGDLPAAESHYRKALEAVEGDQGTTALVLNKLGLCYLAMGRLGDALSAQRRAYHVLKHIEDRHGQAQALNQLGVIRLRQGNQEAAREQFERALELAQRLEDRQLYSDVLLNLAWAAHAADDPESTQARLGEALPLKESLQDPLGLVQGWHLQALISRAQYPGIAVLFGKRAVNILQDLRTNLSELDSSVQAAFVRDKAVVYQNLADTLISQGRLAEAQQVLAMLKEEEYFDFLRRDAATDSRTTRARYNDFELNWTQQYGEINTRLAAVGRELGELRNKARQGELSPEEKALRKALRKQLKTGNKTFLAYLEQLKEAFLQAAPARVMEVGEKNLSHLRSLKGTLRELGRGAVLLHYLITPHKLHIILTTPEIQLARTLEVPEAELNRQVHRLREALTDRRSRSYLREGRRLYDWLLAPVARDLEQAGAATLMLSLDGALRYVPVAALHDGREFVVERYAVSLYTEAARQNIASLPRADWTVAGLGVSEEIAGFTPLPAVAEELEGIVRRSPRDPNGVLDGVVRLNEQFSIDALLDILDGPHPVVHIASHFVFRPGTERESYLLLGSGDRLSLEEIRETLDLHNLDLLTLSACETALGEQAQGSEIEGFGALAQRNGAKGVVATLWPVADASTGYFMQLLYRLRQQDGLTKAEALRQAQLAFLKGTPSPTRTGETPRGAVPRTVVHETQSYAPDSERPHAHPYFWAPFILMGNWL